MPKCPDCGARVSDCDDSCPECDAPLRPVERSSGSKSTSTTTTLLIIGGCVLVGVFLCGGIMVALLLPAVTQARTAARRVQSKNNLKQIGMAAYEAHIQQGRLPPGGTYSPTGEGLHGWMTALLPMMEQLPLYSQIELQSPWNSTRNQSVFRSKIPTFLSPHVQNADTVDGYAAAHYAGNSQVLTRNEGMSIDHINSRDGSANTILAGEVKEGFRPWGAPDNVRDPGLGLDGPGQFGCPAINTCDFVFVDGSVRSVNKNIDLQVLKALASPAGGEPPPTF